MTTIDKVYCSFSVVSDRRYYREQQQAMCFVYLVIRVDQVLDDGRQDVDELELGGLPGC